MSDNPFKKPGFSVEPPPAPAPQSGVSDIFIGKSWKPETVRLKYANRHGLITGATGTGKTVSLQKMAEGFSNAGVPVFAADIKGDLSGIAAPGNGEAHFIKRAQDVGVDYVPDMFPTIFWDVFGEQGHPVRATITEMGPLLLAQLLELNDTQEGILNIGFRVADEHQWPVVDLKDLRALLTYLVDNAYEIKSKYGNVTKDSVGTIQRQILMLENQRGDLFFGEPALDIHDFIRCDSQGRGYVNILAADKLMTRPRLYASFLLWLLSELFEVLPEIGDPEKPVLVFFFDEAHLLFNNAPRGLLSAIEQMVRLIRSKGVGVYFVTQNPLDVPDTVLGQLGNKVQHALRAFTPRDQRAVKAAAETFRQNPKFSAEQAIIELGVGEALVSTLQDKGAPSVVEKTLIAPPFGRVGPLDADERADVVRNSPYLGKYDNSYDRESAYEILTRRQNLEDDPAQGKGPSNWWDAVLGTAHASTGDAPAPQQPARRPPGRQPATLSQTIVRQVTSSLTRSVSTEIARAIKRGILGSLTGRR
ncbi:MAG: DUF853 domain-containing protein [Methylobacteriaceae bacterium]|jgi:DNA helicase HerA-like ATPase|nr:DUF853 domain-containing protein [Methylobacteriaceae bacterium]